MPNRTVLPPLLAELERLGVPAERIRLLCATGTHRPASRDELAELVGEELVGRYEIRNHVATAADEHVAVGEVDGTPVLLDRDSARPPRPCRDEVQAVLAGLGEAGGATHPGPVVTAD